MTAPIFQTSTAGGPYAVTVTTTYGDGSSSSQGFTWTVKVVDTVAPVLSGPGPLTSIAGNQVSIDLSANNSDSDLLTYSAVGLPDGLFLDPDTGIVSGAPAEDAIQSSPYSVTETVTDNSGNSASQTFNWTVTDSTLIVQGNALSATEGAGATFTVATFFDPDLNRQASDYTATISWGDGQSTQGWVDGANGSYTVTGDHAYLHPAGLPLQVTVTDPVGESETVVETASIDEVSLTATGGFQEGAVNNLSSNLTVAVFSDPNTYDLASSYTATIDWGDLTAKTSGAIDGEDGQFRITGNHAYTVNGIYTVTVTITDADGTASDDDQHGHGGRRLRQRGGEPQCCRVYGQQPDRRPFYIRGGDQLGRRHNHAGNRDGIARRLPSVRHTHLRRDRPLHRANNGRRCVRNHDRRLRQSASGDRAGDAL